MEETVHVETTCKLIPKLKKKMSQVGFNDSLPLGEFPFPFYVG